MCTRHYLNKNSEELLLKTIDWLRFPLIVGVVFIHTDFSALSLKGIDSINLANYPIFTVISSLFSKIIFEICVPLFFFISGYLFFYKTAGFTAKIYFQKLKKRVRSLFIPYIFWNLIVLLLLFLAQYFLVGGLVSGKNKPIADFSLSDWIWSFWDTSKINPDLHKSLPINSPLWFIRDLMVIVLVSPVIYFIIKKIGVYAIITFGLLWFLNPFYYIPGCSTVSLFFFSAGAYFSIKQKNIIEIIKPNFTFICPLYVLIIATETYFYYHNLSNELYCVGILTGMALALSITAYFIGSGKWKAEAYLSKSSFFIFAYHRLPLVFVIKLLFTFIHPQSEMALLLLYIICPAIVIGFGLVAHRILGKISPKFTSMISGGR